MRKYTLCFLFYYLLLMEISAQQTITIVSRDTIFPSMLAENQRCESKVKLSATAFSTSPCLDSTLYWRVFIDVYKNGSIDLEYSSFLPPQDTNLLNDTNGNGILDRYIPKSKSGEIIFIPEFKLEAYILGHNVTWAVSELCGTPAGDTIYGSKNISSIFETRDIDPPLAKGPEENEAARYFLDENTLVFAKSFNKGSLDLCSDSSNLLYTFDNVLPVWSLLGHEHYFNENGLSTYAHFSAGGAQKWIPSLRTSCFSPNCDLLYCLNPHEHIITVTDVFKNSSSFIAKVKYYDGGAYCEPYWMQAFLKTMSDSVIIKVAGYRFINFGEHRFIPFDKNYTDRIIFSGYCQDTSCLELVKSDISIKGISTKDVKILYHHLTGKDSLDNIYQWIAADMNYDGKVSMEDLQILRKIQMGLYRYPNYQSWVFFPEESEIVIEDNRIIYKNVDPCFINIPNIRKFKYVALKKGDLDGDYKD